jgi:hypothetical protein
MDKIDRLGWARGNTFIAFGVRFGVRVNDAGIMRAVRERLPPGSQLSSVKTVDHLYSLIGYPTTNSSSRVRRFNLGYRNLQQIARSQELDDLLNAFESDLQITVAEHAPHRVFIHAGVVGWKGRAIVMPGVSFSGKTTLVEQLIRAGATYYSDEYAVLDERGRVHPYARPLGLRRPNSTKSQKIAAEKLGASIGSKPLPIGLVIATRYRVGTRWRPKEITAGLGVLELLGNAVAARAQAELALAVLPKALLSARILKGARGQASEIVDSILRRID